MKKVFIILGILGLVGIIAIIDFNRRAFVDERPQITGQPTNIVGGDADEHGCKASAGYSWCESKSKCLREWEEGCPKPQDLDAIKQAFDEKYHWQETQIVEIKLKTNDGRYASGTINGEGGGGLWFAAKANGEWKIVADGNGIPTCEQLAPYPDFPNTLIKTCIGKTGDLVNR